MFDLIGKTVGPYRILEQVGAGGMATVYKAYQPSMDRYIAVKVLPAHLSRDPDFTKRFQREARAISRLEHSRILPIYDYGEYEGITYIAMRYIKAGTLKDRVSMGGLSLEEINRLISQIGGALDYAHRMGVIHRDVKPANILIDDQGDVYLSDFGLARMIEPTQQLTESGVGLGTPAYMSPEQGQGIKVDHRSDIYSLGVILYEMLTGRVPYEAETPMAVVFKHIHGDLMLPHTINPTTPEPVERVVLKALAKEPADRYQTAGEMAQALNAAVRMMSIEEQQQTVVDKVAPVQQDTSIGTRLQRIWDQPRGKIMLGSATFAAIILLGFLLIQLPGNITILGPNPNQENTPVTSLEAQTPTTETEETIPTTTQSIASNILFNEDFSTTKMIGKYNVDVVGPWKIENGNYLIDLSGPNLPHAATFISPPSRDLREWADYSVEADLMCETNNTEFFAAVGVRSGGENDISLELHWIANYVALSQPTEYQISKSKEQELEFRKWYHLKLTASGNHIWAYVDDRLVIDYTDTRDTQQYYGGIHLTVYGGGRIRCAFDNVRVEEAPTVVITTPSLPVPEGELVFDETFEDGIANGITTEANPEWEIIDDNQGGKVFQIDNWPGDWAGFNLSSTTITDGTIEYRVKLVDYDLSSGGAVACNFRSAPEKRYVFYLAVVTKTVFFDYQGADTNDKMVMLENASAPYILEKNMWYAVRIDIKGNEFTVYIDDKKALTATDDRIKSGGLFGCGIAPNTVAQFDDVRVYALPSVSNVPSLPTQTLSVAMSTPKQTEPLGGGTGRIFFNCGSDMICVMNMDGSGQTQLINGGGHLGVSPDGKQIAFSFYADGQIHTMNTDGSDVRRLTNNKTSEQPDWSPDGSRIVYQSSFDGDFEIFTMNIDGTEQVQLTHNSANDTMAAWSPDGKNIAFVSERDGNPEIYVMNADGTEEQRLTSNLSDDAFPNWSPDGARIVFDSDRDGNYEIYIMKVDGSNQTRVTRNSFKDDYPAWSPDGNWIIFDSDRDGNWEVYLMKTDGTEQTRLTSNSLPDYGPAWQP